LRKILLLFFRPHQTPFHVLTRALIDMDEALEASELAASQRCFERVRSCQPQLVENLLSLNNISAEHAPAFIQRAFLY
jgi:hypothetical protein